MLLSESVKIFQQVTVYQHILSNTFTRIVFVVNRIGVRYHKQKS